LNANLLFPKIESDVSIPEQLQQMKSYLFQFREQIELLLMNIDSDNISEKFKDDFSELVGSKIMNGKEMSQIIQSAGQIKLQVEELGGSVASLTLTTNGIYNQINDPENGILTELSILSGQISASVKFGVDYSGFNISASKLHLFTTGALQIDAGNFQVDTDGNVTIVGDITANRGTFNGTIKATEGNIGNFGIDSYGLTLKNLSNVTKPVVSGFGGHLTLGDIDETIETWIWGSQIRLQTNAYGYIVYGGSNELDLNCEIKVGGTAKTPYWEDIDTIIGTGAYVLVGT